MAIDYSQLAIPKGTRRFDSKKQRKAEQTQQLREVYQAVDARDHHTCRVCGRYCSPLAVGLLARGHRHHLAYRSRGGQDTTANLCTLDAHCHADVHAGRMRLSGDADAREASTGRLKGICVEVPSESGWRVEKFC